jgi:hypothetical protein
VSHQHQTTVLVLDDTKKVYSMAHAHIVWSPGFPMLDTLDSMSLFSCTSLVRVKATLGIASSIVR